MADTLDAVDALDKAKVAVTQAEGRLGDARSARAATARELDELAVKVAAGEAEDGSMAELVELGRSQDIIIETWEHALVRARAKVDELVAARDAEAAQHREDERALHREQLLSLAQQVDHHAEAIGAALAAMRKAATAYVELAGGPRWGAGFGNPLNLTEAAYEAVLRAAPDFAYARRRWHEERYAQPDKVPTAEQAILSLLEAYEPEIVPPPPPPAEPEPAPEAKFEPELEPEDEPPTGYARARRIAGDPFVPPGMPVPERILRKARAAEPPRVVGGK